jgi:hypothetical protein
MLLCKTWTQRLNSVLRFPSTIRVLTAKQAGLTTEGMTMPLIKVCGDTYLNTDCVGKLDICVKFPNRSRTTTTTVYDTTGQHILLSAVTEVPTDSSPNDPHAIVRDNFHHAEILKSIRENRDADKWVEPVLK